MTGLAGLQSIEPGQRKILVASDQFAKVSHAVVDAVVRLALQHAQRNLRQVDGQFAGSYERSCPTERSSGDVAGIVLTNGVLTTHVSRVRVGGAICERTRLHWFEGVVTATSVSMRVSEELACSREEPSSIIVRERQISLTKS